MDFSDKNLFETATYLLRKPGKMLRPALVFLGAKISGASLDKFVDMAAAVEMLHTASLIHDDMIDRDSVRRGFQTVHVRYGEGDAILAGDALIAKAVALAAKYGNEVMESVANASIDMCAGELLDYHCQKQKHVPSVREYLRIARLKNATFMGICCSVAAKSRSSKLESQLYGFGLNLGTAFQIRDDIIEMIDVGERKKNGGDAGQWRFEPNIIRTFEKQFKISTKVALERSVVLNNYFADSALGFIKDPKTRGEISRYVDFVRIGGR